MIDLAEHKRAAFIFFAGVFAEVMVFVDSRRDDVVVPTEDLRKPKLILIYGANLAKPIPDLTVDEQGIHATLSFGNVTARTSVAWPAIYAMNCPGDDRIMIWSPSVPPDVEITNNGPGSDPKKPSHLKLVN